MLLTAVADETYCITTQKHVPARAGRNFVCYRCGMYMGRARDPELGSLLDY